MIRYLKPFRPVKGRVPVASRYKQAVISLAHIDEGREKFTTVGRFGRVDAMLFLVATRFLSAVVPCYDVWEMLLDIGGSKTRQDQPYLKRAHKG
jgi:hypothetical protein